MKHEFYYLYTIIDLLNNKIYIGQTVRPKERWSQHLSYAKKDKPRQYIHRAMNKYGVDNFMFEIVATCKSSKDSNESEKILIDQYDSRNPNKGYNISPGGDEIWNRGLPTEQQPMYGKHHSKESIDKISKSNSGKKKNPHSEETKMKLSLARKGLKFSDEWKEKLTQNNAKITKDIAYQIRKEYNDNKLTYQELSVKYNVSKYTIGSIVRLETWKC